MSESITKNTRFNIFQIKLPFIGLSLGLTEKNILRPIFDFFWHIVITLEYLIRCKNNPYFGLTAKKREIN
jgi:hypothetical protein